MNNSNKIKYILISLVAALLITAILLTAVIFDQNQSSSANQAHIDDIIEYEGTKYVLKDRVQAFLVLGIDKLEEDITSESYNSNQQSDFLMLVVLDNKEKKYSTIHINRDTIAEIDVLGVTGKKIGTVNKQIALAHTYGTGGIDSNANTAKAVSKLFGNINIDFHMSLTLDSVGTMNNLVGGVTLEVLDDFSGVEGAGKLKEAKKGETITLSDEEARIYVQHRMSLDDSSNLARMKRQRQYLEALRIKLEEMVESDELFAAKAVLEMSDYMKYNCAETVLQGLSEKMQEYEFVETAEIMGESKIGEDGRMEFYPNEDSLKKLVINLFYVPKK